MKYQMKQWSWILGIPALIGLAFTSSFAADPSAGGLSPASAPAVWRGTAIGGGAQSDPAGLLGAEALCVEGTTCDSYTLTLTGTPDDWSAARKIVHIHLGWTLPTQDFDFYVHKGDLNGPIVAHSGNGATNGVLTSEDDNLDPTSPTVGTGVFIVHVVYYIATEADQYTGTASVVDAPLPPPAGTEPAGTPRFYNSMTPPGIADFAGEPSIGINRKTEKTFGGIPNGGTVTYFGGFLPYMVRATFDDSAFPARVTWETGALTVADAPRVYGDPILYTDGTMGRTFVAQEIGQSPAGSTTEYTDDDGHSFLPSTGSGPPSGIDHETMGGGPYHAPLPAGVNPLYPNSVWYCSQNIADAVCSISFDGGVTFGPAVPMYTLVECGGLHGHIKIGPDGTAYVPNVSCGPNQAIVVSEDNGATWNVRRIPSSLAAHRDPSVAIGGTASDNTVYFAYQNSDGHSHVAVSRDRGLTWDSDTDVGAMVGVKNSVFHAAVAGDRDRAAVAYFGTTTGGSDYNTPTFAGDWYLYVSTTYDGGHTWWTQNVTPGDPMQRGGICDSGACRNLLDFFGADIDKDGRVLVGYDDGCVSNACITGRRSYGLPGGNDFTAKGVIARQTGGKRMYTQFDPPAGAVAQPPAPAPPPPAGTSCGGLVATDATGDAYNSVVAAAGNADQMDITAVNFNLSPDRQTLSTTITLKNFQTTPAPGMVGAIYRVVWTSVTRNPDGSVLRHPDGTLAVTGYATEATTNPSGVTYVYGAYDVGGNAFVGSTVTTTGSSVTGANGTLTTNMPVSFMGKQPFPVTTADAIPAVIEPFAEVFASEGAVYFTSPMERAPDWGFAGSSWPVCLPPSTACLEESDTRIAYSDGWHTVSSPSASGGSFRFHAGSSPDHSASLSFTVGAGQTGKLTYFYGTSTKGGSADVVLDGVTRTISFAGTAGGMKDPVFGSSAVWSNLAPGPHTLVIKNMSGAVYVDKLCLESSTSDAQPPSGPGATTTSDQSLNAGQIVSNPLSVASGATAISAVAVATTNVPIKLVLVSPTGLTLTTVNSVNGVAVLTQPISTSGTYSVKVVNASLGPVQVWTAVTPTVPR